jgi:hypothetical protein
MLRIFIALKRLSLSAGFEPATFVTNGKYDNHQQRLGVVGGYPEDGSRI